MPEDKKKRRKFIAGVCAVCGILTAIPFVCSERLSRSYYFIAADELSKPVRIAFLSDVHSSPYGRDMRQLTDAVDSFSPDAVVFGGDLFDNEWGEDNAVTLAKRLSEKYTCFYSLGNHEFHKDHRLIKQEMSKLGITVLDGKYADLTSQGGTVRFIGIDGASHTDQLRAAQDAVSHDRFNILIDHYPEEFEDLCVCGFDLMLSGHAHGGQWRIPMLLNGLFAPGQGFFPKYTSGRYTLYGSEMIVSRGLCRQLRDIAVPRIFNRPELSLITLTPSQRNEEV